jgi:hypothetical protein
MVSFKTLAGAVVAALPLASAYLVDMVAPETAVGGTEIDVTFQTLIYIQNWSDFAIIWGIADPTWDCTGTTGEPVCVGTMFQYTNI